MIPYRDKWKRHPEFKLRSYMLKYNILQSNRNNVNISFLEVFLSIAALKISGNPRGNILVIVPFLWHLQN